MHCTIQAVWIVIVVADCCTFSSFFPLLEDPCEVLVTSLICQYSICIYSIYGLLICCISSLNDMTDFGPCRVQTRVCERACTVIKERYLISSPCARYDVFYLLYIRYTQTEIYSPIKKAFGTQAKQN